MKLIFSFWTLNAQWVIRWGGVFQRWWVLLSENFKISGGTRYRPQISVCIKKLQWLPFMWYQNIGSTFFRFVTNHMWQMDRQNYDLQYCASIAAWCGKKRKVYRRSMATGWQILLINFPCYNQTVNVFGTFGWILYNNLYNLYNIT